MLYNRLAEAGTEQRDSNPRNQCLPAQHVADCTAEDFHLYLTRNAGQSVHRTPAKVGAFWNVCCQFHCLVGLHTAGNVLSSPRIESHACTLVVTPPPSSGKLTVVLHGHVHLAT
jgi:hypothetical protein